MFADNLKKLRNEYKITQCDFAKQFHISQGTVGNWESGNREPSFDIAKQIADYFNVTTDYLLGREEKWQKKVRSSEDERTLQILSESEELRRVIDLAATLPEAEQKNLAEYVALRAAQLGKEHQK